MNYDCVVIGGGVIGLSIAFELSKSGQRLAIIDKNRIGRESSWAGAGILPPANLDTAVEPLDQLKSMSHRLHPLWARELLKLTGIDNGYWNCGAVYVARSPGEVSAVAGVLTQWKEEQLDFQKLSPSELADLVPALRAQQHEVKSAVLLPGESQLCNPHHLQALEKACRMQGVDIFEEAELLDFETVGKQLKSIHTTAGPFAATEFCATSGAWTALLLKQLDTSISILPVRGQMLAFKLSRPVFHHVINDGSRYLVPRKDGWVLAGSTLEHAGFVKEMTAEGQKGLFDFANGLIPELNERTLRKRWAGLRPASFDGFPYIGRCPNLVNVIVATGHFRNGLHTSTGTASLVKDLVMGNDTKIDLTPFRVSRG